MVDENIESGGKEGKSSWSRAQHLEELSDAERSFNWNRFVEFKNTIQSNSQKFLFKSARCILIFAGCKFKELCLD